MTNLERGIVTAWKTATAAQTAARFAKHGRTYNMALMDSVSKAEKAEYCAAHIVYEAYKAEGATEEFQQVIEAYVKERDAYAQENIRQPYQHVFNERREKEND